MVLKMIPKTFIYGELFCGIISVSIKYFKASMLSTVLSVKLVNCDRTPQNCLTFSRVFLIVLKNSRDCFKKVREMWSLKLNLHYVGKRELIMIVEAVRKMIMGGTVMKGKYGKYLT